MEKKKVTLIVGVALVVIESLFLIGRLFFGAPQSQEEKSVFIVNRNQTEVKTFDKLKAQGLIKNIAAFKIVLFFKHKQIVSGGYNVSKNMSA